ncbi:hypothetical protein FF011L_55370 [Roseimaritima multifibrata]|uniref:DUF2760 domain-containing protein n=1 Tax=Roseimaritima multifibrata TaxID=1930274 RepID=A0A517MPB4_9BACT|nr:DUF2760 domain-containing protein [Roseimaritima multifibrata]QDS96725.1 hypothetical protein FF011L_55370 [Roseimaritima multifibrata]
MALGTAFRAFFGSLFNSETSQRVQLALEGESAVSAPEPARIETAPVPPAPLPPARSDAVALLATLQREARLVDLVQEKLDAYSDAQVGAAARPCLLQCASILERVMGLQPVVAGSEGSQVEVPSGASPAAYQWIGEGSGTSGQLVHPGWKASRVDLPEWTGQDADAKIIAPAQIKH